MNKKEIYNKFIKIVNAKTLEEALFIAGDDINLLKIVEYLSKSYSFY